MSSKKDKASRPELTIVPPNDATQTLDSAKSPFYSPRPSPSPGEDPAATPSKKKRGVFKTLKSLISKKDKKKGEPATPEPQFSDLSPDKEEATPPSSDKFTAQHVEAVADSTTTATALKVVQNGDVFANEQVVTSSVENGKATPSQPIESVATERTLQDDKVEPTPQTAEDLPRDEVLDSLGASQEEETSAVLATDLVEASVAEIETQEKAVAEIAQSSATAEQDVEISEQQGPLALPEEAETLDAASTKPAGEHASQSNSPKSLGAKDDFTTPPSSPGGSVRDDGNLHARSAPPISSVGSLGSDEGGEIQPIVDRVENSESSALQPYPTNSKGIPQLASVPSAIYATANSFEDDAHLKEQAESSLAPAEQNDNLEVATIVIESRECRTSDTQSIPALPRADAAGSKEANPSALPESLTVDVQTETADTVETVANTTPVAPTNATEENVPVAEDTTEDQGATEVDDKEVLEVELHKSVSEVELAGKDASTEEASTPSQEAVLTTDADTAMTVSTVGEQGVSDYSLVLVETSLAVDSMERSHTLADGSAIDADMRSINSSDIAGAALDLSLTPRDDEESSDSASAHLSTALKQNVEMGRVIQHTLDPGSCVRTITWPGQDLDAVKEPSQPVILQVTVYPDIPAQPSPSLQDEQQLEHLKEELSALKSQLEHQQEEKDSIQQELQQYKQENDKIRQEAATQQTILAELTQQVKTQSESITSKDRDSRSHMTQLLQEREEAVRQQHLVEASRDDLARSQGQLKGKIAKLEGIVASSDKRLRLQSQEIEDLKSKCTRLVAELDSARSELSNTPERCKIANNQLMEQAELAQLKAQDHENRAQKLEKLLHHEVCEREQLTEFLTLEYEMLFATEAELSEQLKQLKNSRAEQALSLAHEREKFMETEFFLQQREKELAELREKHSTIEAVEKEVAELRSLCDKYSRDLSQAAQNVRKAENEVEIINQSNEKMFRYINYVRGRLNANRDAWEKIAEMSHLVKEVNAWYERESGERSRQGAAATPAPTRSASYYTTPSNKLRSSVSNA